MSELKDEDIDVPDGVHPFATIHLCHDFLYERNAQQEAALNAVFGGVRQLVTDLFANPLLNYICYVGRIVHHSSNKELEAFVSPSVMREDVPGDWLVLQDPPMTMVNQIDGRVITFSYWAEFQRAELFEWVQNLQDATLQLSRPRPQITTRIKALFRDIPPQEMYTHARLAIDMVACTDTMQSTEP